MTGNDFVTFFLRTPLHVFMGNTMLLTVTGCRTGKEYSTPVGFYRDGDTLWVMTSRDRTWWRNVKNGAQVSILLKGRTMDAFAGAELDAKAVETRLRDYIQHIPMAAKSLGIRMENKIPNAEDLTRVAKDRLFVRIEPFR
ncbi:MAG TPA: nitroreductase/quinone reductase family protein [Anaerolineales bacterium]|nr:nitroreductase/quinone reductase family protein [Anaerolineales bacterium]